jgi:para-aminobenzoate synthetase component 1
MSLPDPDHFRPLIARLTPVPDCVQVFRNLSRLPHCLFLDSAMRDDDLGRFSFITADPFDFLAIPTDGSDGLEQLSTKLMDLTALNDPTLPPFQGGAAGLFSYDLNRSLESIPKPRIDEFLLPAMAIGLYDVVVAFDHVQQRAWLISQGLPETDERSRRRRAEQRLEQFRKLVYQVGDVPGKFRSGTDSPLGPTELGSQFNVADDPLLTSNFSKSDYLRTVQRVIDYIYAGDIFQVNLAQRLLYPAHTDARSLYLRLRDRNPAPFAGYFDLGMYQIVSASPERFLACRDGWVETRPIKGTRQRVLSPEADLFSGDDLVTSEKDRAENVMIVDLLRNDLSRVCEPDSVEVTRLCALEVYQFVQHLVSTVRGKLAEDRSALDLVRATFPGGSITGAPKIRAMEIISELEPNARGAYCGSLGYVGFDGGMDLSILIRTVTAGRGWWQLPVGGGIVAQSTPQQEYEETWHKARGMLHALR